MKKEIQKPCLSPFPPSKLGALPFFLNNKEGLAFTGSITRIKIGEKIEYHGISSDSPTS